MKNDISTNLDNFYAIKSQFVSIFIFVSTETLDLDTGREPVSTVEKILTLQKVRLDAKDILDLDLDWSRLSRPPCLVKSKKKMSFVFLFIFKSSDIVTRFEQNEKKTKKKHFQ